METTAILVSFAVTRTAIEQVTVGGTALRVSGYVAVAKVDLAKAERGTADWLLLRAHYRGDPPVVSNVLLAGTRPVAFSGRVLASGLPATLPPPLFTQGQEQGLARVLWDEYLLLRQLHYQNHELEVEWIDSDEVDRRRAQLDRAAGSVFALRRTAIQRNARIEEFFLRLDTQTHPGMLSTSWAKATEQVSLMLSQRLNDRALLAKWDLTTKCVPQFRPLESSKFRCVRARRRSLESVSEFFNKLVGDYLDHDPRLLEWAFERFATDGLAVAHQDADAHDALRSHGAPNGAQFFKFVELAFLCLDNDVDTAFWTQHVEALTRVAHVFVEHAEPHQLGEHTMANPDCYTYVEGRHYLRRRLQRVRDEYEEMLDGCSTEERLLFLEDQFTLVVGFALRDSKGLPSAGRRGFKAPKVIAIEAMRPRAQGPGQGLTPSA